MLSRRNLSYPSRRSSPNPQLFILLQTLCRSQKTQLLCNQANPASFAKTPGVGGGHPDPVFGLSAGVDDNSRCRRRNYETPRVGRAERICGTPAVRQLQDASFVSASPFRINTCKSVSKQTTLSSFRINTYEKPREGDGVQMPSIAPRRRQRQRRPRRSAAATFGGGGDGTAN